MVRSLLRQRLGTTRLKIVTADVPAPPYFHAGWSRRAAGTTHLKIAAADAAAPPYFHVRWSRRGAGGPGVKMGVVERLRHVDVCYVQSG